MATWADTHLAELPEGQTEWIHAAFLACAGRAEGLADLLRTLRSRPMDGEERLWAALIESLIQPEKWRMPPDLNIKEAYQIE